MTQGLQLIEWPVSAFPGLLRAFYILCRKLYGGDSTYGDAGLGVLDVGGRDKWGRTRKPIWPLVAEAVAAIPANPWEYTESQFLRDNCAHVPWATQLAGPSAAKHYAAYKLHQSAKLRQEYEHGLRAVQTLMAPYLEGGWDTAAAVRQSLGDTLDLKSTPLFRYCVAAQYGLTDMCDYYAQAAGEFLGLRAEAYMAVWGTRVPDVLFESAMAWRSSLIARVAV